MPAPKPSEPEFGQADLSNCEREQIHLAGSIQPHGALLVVHEPELTILQESANAARFLGLDTPLSGRPLASLDSDLAARIAPLLGEPLEQMPVPVHCRVGSQRLDGVVHRLVAGGLVIELEPASAAGDPAPTLGVSLQTLLSALTLRELCDDAARVFKELTGYDRVMVYRFDEDGHGEVYSERREPHLEAYLGNRYPASDIPQMARRLYERVRVRLLADVAYAPVPLVPRRSPVTGEDLDMSLCALRSMSPIHIQYLKNMGVAATLVISLVVGGRLWGLIACHHYRPRVVGYPTRALCELLAETMATRIAALESFAHAEAELSVRRLEQRMVEAVAREGDWRSALFDHPQLLLQPLGASGAALAFEGQILTTGEVPGTLQIRELVDWLDHHAGGAPLATSSLGLDEPRFQDLIPVASGLLAVPVSRSRGEYLLWFRPERVRTVTWGGNPFKPVEVGDDPLELSPRRSFSQWHQVVEGTSDHWSPAERSTARMIGESLEDVVYQFRAVRMLIVEDQLARIRREVRMAHQPILVADPGGRVLLLSEAFAHYLPPGQGDLAHLDDLPALCTDPEAVGARLEELVALQRPWRGEVALAAPAGGPRTLLLRADPVCSAPGQVLGFVLLFMDLTERKVAEAARREFQEGVLEHQRLRHVPLDSSTDLLYRNLLSSVVGNARLAALEITDGMDLEQVPGMLDAIADSLGRTAGLLERLLRYGDSDHEA